MGNGPSVDSSGMQRPPRSARDMDSLEDAELAAAIVRPATLFPDVSSLHFGPTCL